MDDENKWQFRRRLHLRLTSHSIHRLKFYPYLCLYLNSMPWHSLMHCLSLPHEHPSQHSNVPSPKPLLSGDLFQSCIVLNFKWNILEEVVKKNQLYTVHGSMCHGLDSWFHGVCASCCHGCGPICCCSLHFSTLLQSCQQICHFLLAMSWFSGFTVSLNPCCLFYIWPVYGQFYEFRSLSRCPV